MRGNKWCAVYRREDRRGVLSVARSDYKDEFALLGATAIDCEKQGVDIPMQKTLDALDGQSAMS